MNTPQNPSHMFFPSPAVIELVPSGCAGVVIYQGVPHCLSTHYGPGLSIWMVPGAAVRPDLPWLPV